MRGYGQYCPVALGAEVFAERWTPIIVRNLMIGCERFGEILDGAPGLPRSVLSQRLRRLEACGVITRVPDRHGPVYRLTEAGRELGEVCLALGAWGARWREVLPAHMDPYLALWMLARLIDPAGLPRDRVVVRFDLAGCKPPQPVLGGRRPAGQRGLRPAPRVRRGRRGDHRPALAGPLAQRVGQPRCRAESRRHDRRRTAVADQDPGRVGPPEPLRRHHPRPRRTMSPTGPPAYPLPRPRPRPRHRERLEPADLPLPALNQRLAQPPGRPGWREAARVRPRAGAHPTYVPRVRCRGTGLPIG